MIDVIDRSESPDDRGTTELLLGALAGSTLLPFVQAVATKAGQDVYDLVRDKLSHRGRRAAKAEMREAATVTLAARDARIVLQIPKRITSLMAARLESVRLPVGRPGWLLVSWHEARGTWIAEAIPEPADTIYTVDS